MNAKRSRPPDELNGMQGSREATAADPVPPVCAPRLPQRAHAESPEPPRGTRARLPPVRRPPARSGGGGSPGGARREPGDARRVTRGPVRRNGTTRTRTWGGCDWGRRRVCRVAQLFAVCRQRGGSGSGAGREPRGFGCGASARRRERGRARSRRAAGVGPGGAARGRTDGAGGSPPRGAGRDGGRWGRWTATASYGAPGARAENREARGPVRGSGRGSAGSLRESSRGAGS